MSIRPIRALAAAALLLGSGAANAQRTSYDLERLQLDPTANGSLVLGTGELLPEDAFRISLAAHWERSPLVLEKDGDLRGRGLLSVRSRDRDVVKDRFTGHLGIGLAVTSRVEFGLRVPYVFNQSGDNLATAGYPTLRGDMVGMPTAMLRVGVASQKSGAPVSAAIALEAGLPFYHPDDVDGGHGDVIVPRVEVGRSFGSYLVAGDLGLNYRTRHVDLSNGEKLRHEILAGVVAATTGRPLRLEASLRGGFNFDGVSQSLELLLGARYQLCKYAEAFAIAGPGFMEAPGTPTVRALVGIAVGQFEGKAAPPAPPPPPPVAAAPAPAPVDPCAPGHKHTPEQCPNNDDDGDGVLNKDDKCPLEKGPASNHGCPIDPCAPGQKHTPEQCPNNDDDGDGVLNKDDKCPLVPGIPENHGCPPQRAEIKVDKATGQAKIDIKEKVYFDVNKASIQSRSHPLLDDVAKLMAANPGVKKVVVEGHTDNSGKADYNRKLSKDRAESVKKYLEGKGIAASRLEAKGIGPDRPAEPNTTAKGREANRRVEFIIEK